VVLARKLGKRDRKPEEIPGVDRCRLESGEGVLGSTEFSICRLVVGRVSSIVRTAEVEELLVVVVVVVVVVAVDSLSVAELVSAEDFLADVALVEGKRDLGGWSSMEVEVVGSRLKTYLFL
jgi:hypothetical protein